MRTNFSVLVLVAAGCATSYLARSDSRIAATVDGSIISRDDVAERVARGASPQRALDELIDEELVAQAARGSQLTVSATEVDAAIAEIRHANKLADDAALARALAAQGYTIARYRADLERQLLRLRAINAIVAPRVQTSDPRARRAELDAKTRVWLAELRARAEITIESSE